MQLRIKDFDVKIKKIKPHITAKTAEMGDDFHGACDVEFTAALPISHAGFLFGEGIEVQAVEEVFWSQLSMVNAPLKLVFHRLQFDDCRVKITTQAPKSPIITTLGARLTKFKAELCPGKVLELSFDLQTRATSGAEVSALFEHLDHSAYLAVTQPNYQEQTTMPGMEDD